MVIVRRLLALFVSAVLVAQGADHEPIHYWNGEHRVDLSLALDELAVEIVDAATQERLGKAVGGVLNRDARTPARSTWRFAGVDRGALRQQAATVTLAGARARAVLYGDPDQRAPHLRQVLGNRIALKLRPGQDLAQLCARYQLQVDEQVSYSPLTWIVHSTAADLVAALETANRLYEVEGAAFATPLIEHERALKGTPDDPLFGQQWHLLNNNQLGVGAGNDINVTSVWDFVGGTGLGTGINIAIVDDEVQVAHPDLTANARTDIDTDLVSNDNDPSPVASGEGHGTCVAGTAAARGNNGIGGTGVAPRAGIVGVRLTSGGFDDSKEATAMNWQATAANVADRVSVSNNSWGIPDDGKQLGGAGPLVRAAWANGTANGRGGKGIVYVWAGGNGYFSGDEVNYDGYANSRFVIAVAASRHDGYVASYSEGGACLLINAPGGDDTSLDGTADENDGIVTTDRTGSLGFAAGDYTATANHLAGTSFSAPIVSGVVALMLEANPKLTWRDVKHILVRTATKNEPSSPNWVDNHAVPARHWNYFLGFGRVDALAAVTAAKTWINAPPEATPLTSSSGTLNLPITDNDPTVGISTSRTLSAPSGFRAEYVQFHVNVTHDRRGQLSFQLISPLGTTSRVEPRPLDTGDNYDWTFSTVANWGENPTGTWTLKVFDNSNAHGASDTGVGVLNSWSLTVYGYQPHVAPGATSVTPNAIAQSSPDTTITVTGSGFVDGASVIRWNGSDLPTTVTSGTQAVAVVPSASLAGVGTASVTVANPGFDGEATQISGALSVVVNAAPTITSITPSPASTPEDTPVVLTVNTTDGDTPAGSLVFSATSSNPSVATVGNLVFSGSGFTRTLTVTPVPDATGLTTLTVSVSDGVSTVTQTVQLTITPVGDPPIALGGRFRTQPALLLNGTLAGYDPDGDALAFAKTTGPAHGSVTVQSNGTFAYQPTAGFRGMDVFTYQVTANAQTSAAAQVLIIVAGDANGMRPLIVSEPPDEQVPVSSVLSYQVVVDTRRYVVAPTLAYALVGVPAGMTISGSGLVTWTVSGADRHLIFGIVVQDNITGALDTQTVVLRVVASGASN